MLIESIEKKMKLSFLVAFLSFATSIVMVLCILGFSYRIVDRERNHIYVLDHNIPVLLTRTSLSENRPVEYKGAIDLFHALFFSYPPDNNSIEDQTRKALSMCDSSGYVLYETLKEKGFYNAIVMSSSSCSVRCDSITLFNDNHFIYYGTQRLERATSVLLRKLVTEGNIRDCSRSEADPFGIIIENWHVLKNEDVKYLEKRPL